MKDTRRLAARIRKLATSENTTPEGREVAPGSDGTSLAAILREIDETVLPRQLTFHRGEASLVVSAGNRRLISVDAADGPAASGTRDGVLGRSLTQPDVALLGRLRDALISALPGDAPIFVRTARPPDGAGDFAAGTTAAALASAWGVDLGSISEDAAPPAAIDDFLGTVPSQSRAWLRLDAGSVAGQGGDEAAAARLRAFADSADMAELDMVPDAKGSRFIAIGRAPDDGDCLVFVSDKAEAALLMISAEALDTVKANWRKAVG